ncbi:MAG: TetR/AcrR family transcriptional regulator [Pseudolabrys sp.]
MKKRSYTLKRRAESREETRARIVAATMKLHEELGASGTTISAVAERAGVQRLTVYRHFPDETALFKACTSQWLADHPPPDPAAWTALASEARVRAALAALYGYYRRTERMWVVSYRDEKEVEALRRPMREVRGYLDGIAADLAASIKASGRRRDAVALTLAHAVQFATWQSLKDNGESDAVLVDLVIGWLAGLKS